jgi:hypothetical protein
MLEIGNQGQWGAKENMTAAERRSHMALWCIFAAPLILGGDVRTLSAGDLAIVSNPKLASTRIQPEGKVAVCVDVTNRFSHGLLQHWLTSRPRTTLSARSLHCQIHCSRYPGCVSEFFRSTVAGSRCCARLNSRQAMGSGNRTAPPPAARVGSSKAPVASWPPM